MAFEDLRARFEQILAERGRAAGSRAYADGLYQAMLDLKVAIAELDSALEHTDHELARERGQLADAERRGRLAESIQDQETADLAKVWTAKHAERIALLERKQQVQRDELRMAEAQMEEMREAYRRARAGLAPGTGAETPPEPDPAGFELDRKAKESLVREQLAELKRKLGRQD